jgi:hypothetical protein
MKLCNEIITVFNARYDDDLGDDILIPTTITGASWFGTAAETVDPEHGLKEASKIIIRIPADAKIGDEKAYADPLAWKAAPDVSGLWTLQGGDIIIKGTAEGTDWTQKRLAETFSGICKVLAVTDDRRAPNAPHFKVVGT